MRSRKRVASRPGLPSFTRYLIGAILFQAMMLAIAIAVAYDFRITLYPRLAPRPTDWLLGLVALAVLVLYALLPIMRNTLVGILGVDRAVRESAVAMGMTNRQLLWQVEMPLAFPTILAGLRTATVATIGTAVIAAAIGGGGLGTFIFRGLAMVDTRTILAGAIPAAVMALAADEVLGWFERRYSV